jgi:hypothetical protein
MSTIFQNEVKNSSKFNEQYFNRDILNLQIIIIK